MIKKKLLRTIKDTILHHYHSYEITFNIKFDVSLKCEEDFKYIESIITKSYPNDYDEITLEDAKIFHNLFKDKTGYGYLNRKINISEENWY